METELDALIEQYVGSRSFKKRGALKDALSSFGGEVATRALERLWSDAVTEKKKKEILRLTELVTAYGDHRVLESLINRLNELVIYDIMSQDIGDSTPWRTKMLVIAFIDRLVERGNEDDVQALVKMFESQFVRCPFKIPVAMAIMKLAQRNPRPEFLPVLNSMRPSGSNHVAYFVLYPLMALSMNKEGLPIPAAAPRTDDEAELPIPAEERSL